MMYGEKIIGLIPPEDMDNSYIIPGTNFMSIPNPFSPNYSLFPKFRNAKKYMIHLKSGDALFMPAYWLHYIEIPSTVEYGYSISYRWKPNQIQTNFDADTYKCVLTGLQDEEDLNQDKSVEIMTELNTPEFIEASCKAMEALKDHLIINKIDLCCGYTYDDLNC